jgi:hypothetical protein
LLKAVQPKQQWAFALRESLGESAEAPWYGEAWAEVPGSRALLGDAAYEAAVAEGQAVPLPAVIALALEESGAGPSAASPGLSPDAGLR